MRVEVIAPLYGSNLLIIGQHYAKTAVLVQHGLYAGHMWRNVYHLPYNAGAANNAHADGNAILTSPVDGYIIVAVVGWIIDDPGCNVFIFYFKYGIINLARGKGIDIEWWFKLVTQPGIFACQAVVNVF